MLIFSVKPNVSTSATRGKVFLIRELLESFDKFKQTRWGILILISLWICGLIQLISVLLSKLIQQWRILDFPYLERRGRQPIILINVAENCMKWKKLGRWRHPMTPPPPKILNNCFRWADPDWGRSQTCINTAREGSGSGADLHVVTKNRIKWDSRYNIIAHMCAHKF